MKKIGKTISLILILCLSLPAIFACGGKNDPNKREEPEYEIIKGKNLIYIIGDGMGFNHIDNSKLYMEKDSLAFEEYYQGEVTTHSASDAVTDSAAAATALATGVKTNNKYVGVDTEMKDLQNIMELSKLHGRRTGIVTTDYLSGATPGGFSAHVTRRTDANGMINDQAEGAVDLLIGKNDSTYSRLSKKFTDNGFEYTDSADKLLALPKEGKVVGNIENLSDTPLKDYVAYALDFLTENNENSFTLMIEGAYIDKRSHDKDIMQMIDAFINLNGAVDYVLEWAKGRDDTVVIFTADHETGSLAKAESKDALADSLYGSGDHSAANVPLYIYGLSFDRKSFDNTDVYNIAKSVVLDTASYNTGRSDEADNVMIIAIDPRGLRLLTI